jgi:hypothetical protein
MAQNLIKNDRFKKGSKVNIHYAPIFEGYTTSITDTTIGGSYQITCVMNTDLGAEAFGVGDIAALSFGAGVISSKVGSTIVVDFPNSMFPDSDVMRYVGSEIQHTLVFLANDRFIPDMVVGSYEEEIKQATYGYAKSVYNLQSNAKLKLAPVRKVDDGALSQLMVSKGYCLKSCDTDDYEVDTGGWYEDFPIQLSGTSIDPIYRRAFLIKRKQTQKGNRAKATMEFTLIG